MDNSPRVDPDEQDIGTWGSFALKGCSPLPSLELPTSWHLCVRIADESGKINVNLTRPPAQVITAKGAAPAPQECGPAARHLCWRDALAKILTAHGLDASLTDELQDYWTTNLPPPVLGQPASQVAPEFGSIEDVSAAFGALRNPDVFRALRELTTALPSKYVQKVNINTAPREVLSALIDEGEIVDRIMDARADIPYKNCNQAVAGTKTTMVLQMCDVRSSYFRLEASAVVNGIGKTVRALVRRDQAATKAGSAPGTVSWNLTFVDWQKEGGASLFQEAATAGAEDLAKGTKSGNTGM